MTELLTFKVITLLPVVGLGEKVAVTPLGKPDVLRVILSATQADSVGVTVTVPLLPSVIDSAVGEDARVKASDAEARMVRVTEVVTVMEPETPVMITGYVPTVAVLPAVSARTLLPVVGLLPKVAATPLGRPVTARVTLPLNGLMSVTVIMSVTAQLPSPISKVEDEGLSVKPPP